MVRGSRNVKNDRLTSRYIHVPVALPDIPFRTERQSYFFSRESHRNPGKGTSTETGDPISGCDVRDGRRIYRGRGRWCDRVDPSFGFFRRPQSRSAYPKLYKYVVRKNRVAMRPRRSTLSLTSTRPRLANTRVSPRRDPNTPQTPPSSLSGPLVVVFRFASLVRASLFLFFSLGLARARLGSASTSTASLSTRFRRRRCLRHPGTGVPERVERVRLPGALLGLHIVLPTRGEGQGHEDGLDAAAGAETEGGPAVVDELNST